MYSALLSKSDWKSDSGSLCSMGQWVGMISLHTPTSTALGRRGGSSFLGDCCSILLGRNKMLKCVRLNLYVFLCLLLLSGRHSKHRQPSVKRLSQHLSSLNLDVPEAVSSVGRRPAHACSLSDLPPSCLPGAVSWKERSPPACTLTTAYPPASLPACTWHFILKQAEIPHHPLVGSACSTALLLRLAG